jgi:predicted HicB family RNase H-like nuclease
VDEERKEQVTGMSARAAHKPDCPCPVCERKRTGELSAKSPRLGVQVSAEEAALVRRAAADSHLSVNAWLRRLIQERFREELRAARIETTSRTE